MIYLQKTLSCKGNTFPKKGDKMFIITYDEGNIDIHRSCTNGTRYCVYIIQTGYNVYNE